MKWFIFTILYSMNFRSEYGNCDKVIFRWFLWSYYITSLKKWVGRLSKSDLHVNIQSHSGKSPNVDEDAMLSTVENKSRISMEDIAKRLKFGVSPAFRHLKIFRFKNHGRFWQLENVSSFTIKKKVRILQHGTCCRLFETVNPPAPTFFFSWQVFLRSSVLSVLYRTF